MDQLFSILAQSLKTEITCIEDLFSVIQNSPITPKPTVDHLWYIFDWQSSIRDSLTEKQLENHSFYNSFRIKKSLENKKSEVRVMLQAKPLPQDSEWGPPTGIQLLKLGVKFPPVPSAGFRVEDLNLGKAIMSLKPYISQMPENKKIFVSKSWEKLVDTLESLPRRQGNFEKMKIEEFPKQSESGVNKDLQPERPKDLPALKGAVYPANLEEGSFYQEVCLGMDVAVYTRSKRSRPWLGRVTEIDAKNGKFKLQWFSRRSRGSTFYGMKNADSSPFVSEQDVLTVMFWQFTENRNESSFSVSSYWLDKIAIEAEMHDECNDL